MPGVSLIDPRVYIITYHTIFTHHIWTVRNPNHHIIVSILNVVVINRRFNRDRLSQVGIQCSRYSKRARCKRLLLLSSDTLQYPRAQI